MTPYAATATHPIAVYACLLVTLLVVTFGYLVTCYVWPFTYCRRCHGSGKSRSWFGRATFALCRRCDGTGRTLRPGRRVLNYLRGLHDKADR